MSTYDKIWWLPISGGLTGIGLVLSYLAMRRRGLRAGLRGAAWSLLPLATYLTGSIKMFWKMGVAIGDFAKGFAFSTQVWAGIAVAGVSLVLLLSTGGVRRRRAVKPAAGGAKAVPGSATTAATAAIAPSAGATPAAPKPAGAKPARAQRKADDDDDMKDIEEILRRRGIS
jgi:hypothetical protein